MIALPTHTRPLKPTSLYNLRALSPNTFQIAKFDEDFNVAAIYNLSPKGTGYSCDCPANNRTVITKLCKHRRMLPLMLGAVNTDRFYNPDNGSWCQPLGDIARPEAGDPAGREAMPEVAGAARPFEGEAASEASEVENEVIHGPTPFEFAQVLAQPQPPTALAPQPQSAQVGEVAAAALTTSALPPRPTSGIRRR